MAVSRLGHRTEFVFSDILIVDIAEIVGSVLNIFRVKILRVTAINAIADIFWRSFATSTVQVNSAGLYIGRRFCQPGVVEPYKSQADQTKVAFFYENGYDDIPGDGEGFNMLPKGVADAPYSWAINLSSSDCSEAVNPTEPLDGMLCSIAKELANGTISTTDYHNSGGDGLDQFVTNPDGSVAVT